MSCLNLPSGSYLVGVGQLVNFPLVLSDFVSVVARIEEQDMITTHNWLPASVRRHIHLHFPNEGIGFTIIHHDANSLIFRCL